MENAHTDTRYTAFDGPRLLWQGTLPEVVLKVKRRLGKAEHAPILIFSDATGKSMDFNFQGTEKDVLKRLEVFVGEEGASGQESGGGPGRPKLGVVSREVSLLPRQWEWLASQAGGASAILRRLVDEAKRKSAEGNAHKQIQERAYKFMSVMAGDLEGYEEALRALYKKDGRKFQLHCGTWPEDIRRHAMELAGPVLG